MSAGIGSSVYNDQNYDTVFFDEELVHDFASWVYGDSMEPKNQNGSVALIRETGFDYDGAVYAVVCNNQTYIKRVYREEHGLKLVSINPKYREIFFFHMMKIQELWELSLGILSHCRRCQRKIMLIVTTIQLNSWISKV